MTRIVSRGFTLIELLVVIAIIAILAAILMPVFSRAREKARQISCLSNIKNLATAVAMYTQDYDELLPAGSRNITLANGTTAGLRWAGQIQAYIKNLQIFSCPSDENRTVYGGLGGATGGYGYNACFLNNAPLAAISQPAGTIIITDSCTGGNRFRTRPDMATTWCNAQNNWTIAPIGNVAHCSAGTAAQRRSRVAYRHTDFTDIAFVDGHAKAINFAEINRTATTEGGAALNSRQRFVNWNLF